MVARKHLELVATAVSALVAFRAVDGGLYRILELRAPRLALLADLRITSLVLIASLVVATHARASLGAPRMSRRVVSWSAAWLAGESLLVHFTGIGRVPLERWQDVVAFSATGPVAEELLVRGLVLTAAQKVWPSTSDGPSRAGTFSAVVFSLMHLQYWSYEVSAASCAQMLWTFPLGILCAWIAERTKSLRPSVALHLLNNLLVQVV